MSDSELDKIIASTPEKSAKKKQNNKNTLPFIISLLNKLNITRELQGKVPL